MLTVHDLYTTNHFLEQKNLILTSALCAKYTLYHHRFWFNSGFYYATSK